MDSETLLQEIKIFRKKAAKGDYATSDPKSWAKEPDGSTTIEFASGDWKSQDNFFGGEPYGGREVVFYKGKPVWIFVYYGWVEPFVENVQEVYDFLKEAMREDPDNKVFRGPKKFAKGQFNYRNSWQGGLGRFSGEEIMYKSGKEIYRAKYMGGLVDQRKDKETSSKMVERFTVPITEKSQPYNFDFFLTHYVFAPWVVEGKKLVRLFKLDSGKFVLTRVGFKSKPKPILIITLQSKESLTKSEQKQIIDLLSWIFAVNEEVKYFYEVICQKDPVLKAASEEIYGAHLRTDPYVFESVLGVIMAQNVLFKRIYEMNRLLCERFGEKQRFNGKTYYTFPTPQRLAKAKLDEIRACKVGYRDKYIKGVAEKIVNENINLDDLRKLKDIEKIRERLIELPGVGPYTADLAIAIGFRLPTFHLDLFSREALYQFYFNGKKVPDKKLVEFADKRWGKWKHNAMLLLTTNTDTWAKKLNYEFRLKSGAKSI